MSSKGNQKLSDIFQQGKEQITTLFMEAEKVKMENCMQRNIDNMENFVRCGAGVNEVLKENMTRLEVQIMFCSIQAQDCLNTQDYGVCVNQLESNLNKIYQEYRGILN